MNIIGNRKIFFVISGLLIIASVFSVFFFGLKQGIDLVGGANWQIRFKSPEIVENEVRQFLAETVNYANLTVKALPENNFLVRLPALSEEQHTAHLSALREKFGEVDEQSFESIGPTIGRELKQRFLFAFCLGLICILLYVAWAFRKISYPIKSWKYGAIAILCLFHDVLIPAGVMAFLGWRQNIEIDTTFIVALLFILGYSVNDTIVVFDRIRENLFAARIGRFDFAQLINDSINQIFSRSVNTSLTTILALVPVYFWGPAVLKYFILTLMLGIFFGTYSSIFIASPLLFVWHRKKYKE